MPEQLERLYTIGGQRYWEGSLKKSENCTVYHLDGNPYTQKQLETMSESWSIYYNIDGSRYTKGTLERQLPKMSLEPNSTRKMGPMILTRQQIERALSLTQTPIPSLGGTQEPHDSRPETTQTAFSGEGIEAPLTHEDDGEDELVARVLANLQAKMEAVKRRKEVAAEVEKLRRLLADKEAYLMECERVMALEVGQVKAD